MGSLHGYFKGVNLFFHGHVDEAETVLQECLIHSQTIASERPPGMPESSPLRWHAAYLLASLLLAKGSFSKAAELFQRCSAQQRYRPSDSLCMRALALLLDERHEEACQAFEAAIEEELHQPLHLCSAANMSEIFRGVPGPYEYRLLTLLLAVGLRSVHTACRTALVL